MDLDAVEAHLTERLEVKALARFCGKHSGEAGFLKRVLRYDAVTGSFFWCSGKRNVQDAARNSRLLDRPGISAVRGSGGRVGLLHASCTEVPGRVQSENARQLELQRSSCRRRKSPAALSSAEAEFHACNRGTAGGLQTCHFLTEAVYEVIPRVWSDSSACRRIVRRTGSGRLRHLEI